MVIFELSRRERPLQRSFDPEDILHRNAAHQVIEVTVVDADRTGLGAVAVAVAVAAKARYLFVRRRQSSLGGRDRQ